MTKKTWLRDGIPLGTAPSWANIVAVNAVNRLRTNVFFVIVSSIELVFKILEAAALGHLPRFPPPYRDVSRRTAVFWHGG
jgi:hypothetical protein